jgi:hypothetical protein
VSDAITDTLLFTLADIHAHADVTFDLDSAIRVLESAQAGLEAASADEKRRGVERAKTLAAESNDSELIAFFEALIESLTDDADVEG